MQLHSRHLLSFVTLVVASSSALAESRIVITEIMYNPASNEKKGEAEWIEIANIGAEPVDVKDWTLKVHEKKTKWGTFSCTLAPGGVAVLINDAVKEDQFRAAWDEGGDEGSAAPRLNYQVIPVKWGALANDASDQHPLQLLNEKSEVVCEVKQSGDWPKVKGAGGPSIFLSDMAAADISSGTLWRISQQGLDGARHNTIGEPFDKQDCGSPGYVPGLNGNPAATTPATPVKEKKAREQKENKEKSNDSDKGDKGNTIDY